MTAPSVAECRLLRIAAEAAIMNALREFQTTCAADLTGGIEVELIVRAGPDGEPRRFVDAVHIYAVGTKASTRTGAELAESRIRAVLDDLSASTGLDLARVEFFMVPAGLPDRTRRRLEAVRVELCV